MVLLTTSDFRPFFFCFSRLEYISFSPILIGSTIYSGICGIYNLQRNILRNICGIPVGKGLPLGELDVTMPISSYYSITPFQLKTNGLVTPTPILRGFFPCPPVRPPPPSHKVESTLSIPMLWINPSCHQGCCC